MFVLLFTVMFSPTVSSPPRPDPLFTDADGDGYKGIVEVWWGCDQFDDQSFPYCLEWDTSTVVACEPVSELIPLVPCEL
jgi:hypothetical protein